MDAFVLGALCAGSGAAFTVLITRALHVRDVLSEHRKAADLQALQTSLQELNSLLETDAEELDIVRRRFEGQISELSSRLLLLERGAPTQPPSVVDDERFAEIVHEVQLLGGELSRLKRGPSVAAPPWSPAGVNVDAFGANPMAPAMHTAPAKPLVQEVQVASRKQASGAHEGLDPERRKLRVLVDIARSACAPNSCCNCKFWDQDEGQEALRQAPVFARAAMHVPPNRMGTPVLVDAEGDALPDAQQPPPMLPAKLNKWELFGACLRKNQVLHAIDTCDEFERNTEIAG